MAALVTESSLKGRVEEILPGVAKPARYMGGELNSVRKPPEEVSVRFALAFPDIYEVGMSNLGLRILYHILNSEPGVAAERVFAPALDMESQMRSGELPLFSLESSLPIRMFDLVGFSLAYELSYTTVLNMLDLAGIPILARDRTENDPIIVAGGHCACNPEPMAEFIDAFAVGDGEEVVLDMVSAYSSASGGREEAIEAISRVEGVYVPSVYGRAGTKPKVQARIVADLENAAYPDKLVVPFTEAVHDRAVLEVMRGCSRGCRFCQAGMITRPVRERSLAKLCEQADTLLENTGYEEIALTSLSSADYSRIDDLVCELIDRHEEDRVGISLPSLRADAECVNLAAQIQRVRKSGLTFAPEAGTQRLRDVINKNVTEEDLLEAVDAAVQRGWRRVKLYFMIGLPTETDDDLRGIGRLVTRVIDIGRAHRKPLTLNVTVSPFVPKPHTPFQWRAMDTVEELERKIALIRPMLKAKNIMLSWHDPKSSRVEAALARGDSRVSKAVLEAWRCGARLEQDNFDYEVWLAAFETAGIEIDDFANVQIPKDHALPWDHIDVGVTRSFLADEDAAADEGKTTGDCRLNGCANCGVRESLARSCGGEVKCPPVHPESGKPEPRQHRKPGEAVAKVMFTFRKGLEVRWLGHLDLMGVFERALRMSGLDVAYSQGFNPRPKMSVASALPLGATAENEILTMQIAEPVDLKSIAKRLNGSLPDGVTLLEARLLPPGVRGPEIKASEFVAEVQLPSGRSVAELKEAVAELLGRDSIPVVRESKKRRKTVDLRPGIESIEVVESNEAASAVLSMILPHLQFTVRPAEVVAALAERIPGLRTLSLCRSRLISIV